MNAEQIAWIRLNRTGLSPQRQLALLRAFGSPAEIFAADDDDILVVEGITDLHLSKLRKARQDDAPERDAQKLKAMGARLLTYTDDDYPALLRQIPDPPMLLYVLGELQLADQLLIAMVGTRRPSQYGRQVAHDLARDLAQAGAIIVSGLAVGIDGAAHQGALDGKGRTIAVLGCGLDVIYPRAHAKLRERIISNGALITEMPLGVHPQAWHFPVRNRIISGLSLATIVVEAPHNSGALITADWALEQGREVFVVPGPITNPRFKGNHQLLKEGAQLIECADDVFNALGIPKETLKPAEGAPAKEALPMPSLPGLSPVELKILQVLSKGERHVDQIVREAALSVTEVTTALLQLEVKGLAVRHRGGMYVLSNRATQAFTVH